MLFRSTADLGAPITVWFTLGCGGEPEVGVANGTPTNAVVRVTVPNPRMREKAGSDPVGTHCSLAVRVSDTKGFESNTLTTTLDFK